MDGTQKVTRIGHNVTARIVDSILTLEIDLTQHMGPARGTAVLIASTNGNATLPSGERIGVNVYRKEAA